jgi:(p)ppGpp synthase/HD superfamily hydrolase
MPESYTDAPLLSERFDLACLMASAHHRTQLRKGTTVPYVSHLLAVASLVLEMEGTEDEAIGALLHDMVEDDGGPPALARIEATFGARVAEIVAANSDSDEQPRPPWEERKRAYLAGMATKPADALRVSLADKLHNARAILRDYRVLGEDLWARFRAGGGDAIRWYYRSLALEFAARAGDLGPAARPALEELERTVRELDALAGGGRQGADREP